MVAGGSIPALKACPKCGQMFRKTASFNRHWKKYHSKKGRQFTPPPGY